MKGHLSTTGENINFLNDFTNLFLTICLRVIQIWMTYIVY